MDWSQIAYISSLAVALLIGRAPRLVVLVMVGNLVATATLSGTYLSVGVVDVVSSAVLVAGGRYVLAALFAAMIPVYLAGDLFGWSSAIVYTAVDVLAYFQLLVVIGGGGGGIRKRHDSHRHGLGRIFRGADSRGRDPQVGGKPQIHLGRSGPQKR